MHIHILGICGTFMGGVAALAREAGHEVTGCDTSVYPPMSDQLRSLGIDLVEGYAAAQLDQPGFAPDMFVIGNVVSRARSADGSPRYPLMEAILDRGLPYTSGPQWLAEHVLQGRHVLAIAGTHGKTTTTAMLAWILEHAGLNPGFLVGGVPLNFGVSARLGSTPTIDHPVQAGVVEAASPGHRRSAPLLGSERHAMASVGAPSSQAGAVEPASPGHRRSAPPGGSEPRAAGSVGTPSSQAGAVEPASPGHRRSAPPGGSETRAAGSVGALFVLEADEYDTAFFDKRSKFVHYRPRTAVLNNLEFDHADIFESLVAIERQFHHLLRTVPASGRVVFNATEASLQRVLDQGCWSERVPFGGDAGRADNAGFTARGEPHDFDILKDGEHVAHLRWSLGGVHNQRNALAAIGAAEHVGVAPARAAEALASFRNVKRRMEVRGTVRRAAGDITVYDDFAHHPTAIQTTVDGLRRQLLAAGRGRDRILAIFEPRSNTMKLGTMTAQLPASLAEADLAFCHAGGLDWNPAEALAPMGARAQVAGSIEELLVQVLEAAQPGDHLLCMSNGGFGGIHARLLSALSAGSVTSAPSQPDAAPAAVSN